MFKYLSSTPALPLPSCTHTPSFFSSLPLRLSLLLHGCKPKRGLPTAADLQPRMGGWWCRCRLGGGWEREEGTHPIVRAGQHPLSSGAPSDRGGGARTRQSRILIWLCKYLLQKAMLCNPYPRGGERRREERRDRRRGSSRNAAAEA